jgi:hypothetical protein
MKRAAILLCDVVVCILVIGWSMLGPWDRILGFSVYHSRGDVWLPMPPAAADFFRGIVSTGTTLFAIFFLLISILIFIRGRSGGAASDPGGGTIPYRAFYGNALQLLVKYSAVLFISFISPFFYNYMWRFAVTRPFKIAGGAAISIAAFTLVVAIAALVARAAPQRRLAVSI